MYCIHALIENMAKNVYCRKPLGQREARIIKRLKKVGRMPVTTIAKVTERNKTTIYVTVSKQFSTMHG